MEQVLEYTIPVLHPLVVHVPVAMLPLGAVILLGWMVRDRPRWLIVAAWIHLVGTVGAVAAVRTGAAMEEQSEGVPIVERLLPVHEDWAEGTAWAAGAVLILLLGTMVWNGRATHRPGVPLPWRVLLAAAGVVVAAMVLWTGHVGGVMVWGVMR